MPARKPKTYIVVVLDSSGSMQPCKYQAIEYYNGVVDSVKNAPKGQTIKVGLCLFGAPSVKFPLWDIRRGQLNYLDDKTYSPMNLTPLHDAIGMTIDKLHDQDDINWKSTSVVVNVITDGGENSSRTFNKHRIAQMVKELQDTDRWTFSIMGANQDAVLTATNLGMHAGNAHTYKATPQGTQHSAHLNRKQLDEFLIGKSKAGLKEFSSKDFYANS